MHLLFTEVDLILHPQFFKLELLSLDQHLLESSPEFPCLAQKKSESVLSNPGWAWAPIWSSERLSHGVRYKHTAWFLEHTHRYMYMYALSKATVNSQSAVETHSKKHLAVPMVVLSQWRTSLFT